MTASTCPADSIGSRTAALMMLCLTLESLMPFSFATAGHSLADRSSRHTEGLARQVRQCADAPALAGDDGVGRPVEQNKHGLDGRVGLVFVAVADQRVDVDQRKIAGACGDASDRIRRSAGDIGRHAKALGAEQAVHPGHHERRGHRVDRAVERELDRDRLPRLVRRLACARRTLRQPGRSARPGQAGCVGLTYAHGDRDRSCCRRWCRRRHDRFMTPPRRR